MKPWQRDQLHRALELRREVLLGELSREAALHREVGATDAITDAAEDADALRDLAELRDIEAARQRAIEGRYGICTDCGADIGFERLHAEPEAARCIECQRRHEKTYRA
jgi:RNA polymerase-binding transcription factor DksA